MTSFCQAVQDLDDGTATVVTRVIPLAQAFLSLPSTALALQACFYRSQQCHSPSRPQAIDDVLAQASVPDVPDAASDSLNATPVLKLSSYLSPQRNPTAGMPPRELLSPATDDLAEIHRQVAMYHCPHRTAQSPFSRSRAVPSIEVWPSQKSQLVDICNIRIRGPRRSPEPHASSDGDDVCERHRLPADITKQGTQASLIGLPLADTGESPERSGPRTASSYHTDNAAVCVPPNDQSDRLHEA